MRSASPEICDYLIVDAPFPPSLNRLFEPHLIGKRCSVGRSSKYVSFQKSVFNPWWMSVRSKGRMDFGEAVIIWLVVCPPQAGIDLDNRIKCLGDCLQTAGGIRDDKLVVSLRLERGPRIRGGMLRMFIANERHRAAVAKDYEEEFSTEWLPRRDGPILDPAPNLRLRRAAIRS